MPEPSIPPAPNAFIPSQSTVMGASLALPLVEIVVWALHQFARVTVPAEIASAGAVLVTSLIAYFGNGGKAIHTA